MKLAEAILSTHEVEKSVVHLTPELLDSVLKLKNLTAVVAPKATEVRHSKGFTFYDAQRGGPVSAGICPIVSIHEHIELAFIMGLC